MRNSAEISNIIATAKISYSSRVQLYEIELQKGINIENWIIFTCARNLLNQDLLMLNLSQQNLLADWLIRNGFVLLQNNLLFSEFPFNSVDFDIV